MVGRSIALSLDGSALHVQHWAVHRPKGLAILIHGFGGNSTEFGALGDRLQTAGFEVVAFDQRGFGGSEGERGLTSLSAVVHEYQAIKAHFWTNIKKPLFVVGHSLGGAYSLAIAAKDEHVSALAIAHVPENLLQELSAPRRLAYHALGKLNRKRHAAGKPNRTLPTPVKASQILQDKTVQQTARRECWIEPRINLGNYDFLRTMSASAWASKVKVPTLIIQSENDHAADPTHSQVVYDSITAPKTLLRHEGGHSCFRDHDSELIIGGVAKFFESRCSS